MSKLTHLDQKGDAHMVDVSDKTPTKRRAVAGGSILMSKAAFDALTEEKVAKGNVLGVARIAAIQGAKQTSNLIPLCHPLPLSKVGVEFSLVPEECRVDVEVTASTLNVTGVEMEALTGVSVALLTIYDMLKAVDKEMEITHIALLEKEGGKSGDFKRGA